MSTCLPSRTTLIIVFSCLVFCCSSLFAAAGDSVFTFNIGWHTNSSPALADDGTIYIGSRDGNMYAVNPDGTEKWKYTIGVNSGTSPAVANDGTIYIGAYDNFLYAINSNGSLKWKFEARNFIFASSPAIGADQTIYVGSSWTAPIGLDTVDWK